jgi:hypothetical protein
VVLARVRLQSTIAKPGLHSSRHFITRVFILFACFYDELVQKKNVPSLVAEPLENLLARKYYRKENDATVPRGPFVLIVDSQDFD